MRVCTGATSLPAMLGTLPSGTDSRCRPVPARPGRGRSQSRATGEASADGSPSVPEGSVSSVMGTVARLVVPHRAPLTWTPRPKNQLPNSHQPHSTLPRTPSSRRAALWQLPTPARWLHCCASPRTSCRSARARWPFSNFSTRCLPHIRTLPHAHALGCLSTRGRHPRHQDVAPLPLLMLRCVYGRTLTPLTQPHRLGRTTARTVG